MKPWFDAAFAQFKQLQQQQHLPHALLISGHEHIGKLEFAQLLVQELSGKNIAADNLDTMDEELLLRHSHYMNLIYCQRELNKNKKLKDVISVEQIRDFTRFLHKTSDAIQIGIIRYADELHHSAANALLKTLEEPRENTLIILLAHNVKSLPITITSRCMQLHISADEKSLEWIKEQSNTELKDSVVLQLLQEHNYVPAQVVSSINSGEYLITQKITQELITIAINPNNINTISHLDNVPLVLRTLRNLVLRMIYSKTLTQEENDTTYQHLVVKTPSNMLFLLLEDINYASYLLHTTLNQKLLIDSLLIIWSHITHLSKYPEIFSKIRA